MKIHIRVLGAIYLSLCGLALVAGITLCILLGMNPNTTNQKALEWIGPPVLILAVLVLIPGVVGGVGLLQNRSWARLVLLILSIFFLPLLPLGTAIGIYGLWVLFDPETKALFASPNAVPAAYYPRPLAPVLNLLGVMAGVAAGFFLVLKVGFLLHKDPVPAPFESPVLTVTAVLIVFAVLVAGIIAAINAGRNAVIAARIRREANASASAHAEVRRLRAAELAADPRRAKYALLVERGEDWSDENIDYAENTDRTATCVHLQALERAMRRAGIHAARYRTQDSSMQCRLDFAAVQPVYHLDPPVRYAEFMMLERFGDEHPTAFLICDEHKSIIHLVHPDAYGADKVPWFP